MHTHPTDKSCLALDVKQTENTCIMLFCSLGHSLNKTAQIMKYTNCNLISYAKVIYKYVVAKGTEIRNALSAPLD